ncbi:MAG: sigma-70 family RNA polymerase sigma factor [Ruminococcus sp.]|nr:sigma-70 family RNA polymerase sigma factor [Ruminococcus sp.]
MDDRELTGLFLARDEAAVAETENKYGAYCRYIARSILSSEEDCEECTADALAALWNSIPPEQPDSLKAYLARTVRNLALNRVRAEKAEKRGGLALPEAAAELSELCSDESVEEELDAREMKRCIDGFASSLPKKQRQVFVLRYWYLCPIEQIASETGMTANAVTVALHRLRKKLKKHLESEGYEL